GRGPRGSDDARAENDEIDPTRGHRRETIRWQARVSPGRPALVVSCGNSLTCRCNTRPLPESLFFSDSSVLHAIRTKPVPQKAAPTVVFAPLFDVVGWHRSCESSNAEGQSVRHERSVEQGAGSGE